MKKTFIFLSILFLIAATHVFAQVGVLSGTGMSICNIYSFSICPSQTITPLNYGNQGYACNNTSQPDVSYNIMGGSWRVNKFNWNFTASTSGFITGYTNTGSLQSFAFATTNTVTPLSYSGLFIQFAINGVATGPLLSQSNFSISLTPAVFGSNSYSYCASTATSIAISPIIPISGGPWTYNWQPGGLTGSTVNVSPSANTIYTVTETSSGGCISTTTIAVTATCVAQSCGGSLQFNNNSDAVQLPLNNQMYSSNGFTWECWFKLTTPFLSSARALIDNVDPVVYEDIFLGFGWIYGTGNFPINHLGFKVDGPNATTGPTNVSCDYAPPGGFILGTWYHTAGVMDYATHTAKLYLNGVLVDTKTVMSDPFSRNIQGQLSYDPGIALGGNMDEVRIWKKARTASEILADYNQCLAGTETDLLMYYRCNQASGSIVNDATPGANNGTFVNSTTWSSDQPILLGSSCGGVMNFSSTPSLTICAGSTATLSATGVDTYNWSNGLTTNTIVVSPLTTTSYTVIGAVGTCTSLAVSIVSVTPSPMLTLSSDTIICEGGGSTATLTATGATFYSWNNASSLSSSVGNSVTAFPNATTDYTVTGVTGICSNTAVVTVSVNPSPTITTTFVNQTSCGLANGSATVNAFPTSSSYAWSSGTSDNSNAADSLAAGNYTVTVINGACSTSTVINVLGSIPLVINSSTIIPSNCNASNGSISVTDNFVGTLYSWTPNISSSGNVSAVAPGNYALSLTNGACQTFTVFVVGLIDGPTALHISVKNVFCESDSGSVKLDSVINGVAPYLYSFNNSGFSSLQTYTNLAQGNYIVAVKDVYGCVYTQTLAVNKDNIQCQIDLITKKTGCEMEDGEFFINNITGGNSPYVVSFNNGPYNSDLKFDMLAPGIYTLNILDSNRCKTDFVLTMPETSDDYILYVPNTFTPNKDEINDVWLVKGACLNSFNCLIYNRWGEKLAELKNINESWNGTYKGVPVQDGVYVYLIEAETQNGTINKTGHITVFR